MNNLYLKKKSLYSVFVNVISRIKISPKKKEFQIKTSDQPFGSYRMDLMDFLIL